MKANELMIGDLFRVNKDVSFKKGTIVVIRGIDADRTFHELKGCATCVALGDPDEMQGGVWLEYLDPIPLTAEILEQNGFFTKDKPDNWTGYRTYKYSDGSTGIAFRLYHDTGKYKWSGKCEISLNALPYWIRFEYLHELQHILKFCGIDNEITIKVD